MSPKIIVQTFVVVLVCLGVVPFAMAGELPNSVLTPGATNPEVTQQNLQQTVCVKGYTKTIRPPTSYTNKLKRQQIRQYGYVNTNIQDYEEDHLIALSIGGNPTDPKNLWPEPRNAEWGAAKKDQLEYALYKKVCAGEVSLASAQKAMSENWIEAWQKYASSNDPSWSIY